MRWATNLTPWCYQTAPQTFISTCSFDWLFSNVFDLYISIVPPELDPVQVSSTEGWFDTLAAINRFQTALGLWILRGIAVSKDSYGTLVWLYSLWGSLPNCILRIWRWCLASRSSSFGLESCSTSSAWSASRASWWSRCRFPFLVAFLSQQSTAWFCLHYFLRQSGIAGRASFGSFVGVDAAFPSSSVYYPFECSYWLFALPFETFAAFLVLSFLSPGWQPNLQRFQHQQGCRYFGNVHSWGYPPLVWSGLGGFW